MTPPGANGQERAYVDYPPPAAADIVLDTLIIPDHEEEGNAVDAKAVTIVGLPAGRGGPQ